VHPIYRKCKVRKFPCEDGNSSLPYSFGQDKSSDWSFSERNMEEETNSNKVNTKASLCLEDQCHEFGIEGLFNKNNQIEGSMLDTCIRDCLDND
jgi:hypothetical protein